VGDGLEGIAEVNQAHPYVSPVEVADMAWYEAKYVTSICCRNDVRTRPLEESESKGLPILSVDEFSTSDPDCKENSSSKNEVAVRFDVLFLILGSRFSASVDASE
jgi:hypothetical protein